MDPNDIVVRKIVANFGVPRDEVILWVTSSGEMAGWVKIRTPYNADWIAALKVRVPGKERRWMKDQKAWAVSPEYADALIDVTGQFFKKITQLEKDPFGETNDEALAPLKKSIGNMSEEVQDRISRRIQMFGERKVEI